jgi:hypothetical protein
MQAGEMELLEKLGTLSPERKYLFITHSDRPLALELCDLNYLERRYARPGRLPPAVPFEALQPSTTHSPYHGEITVHDLGPDGRDPPRLVARFRPPGYKPQHAVWHEGHLWVVGVEHLAVYDASLAPVARIEDPWLAGGHTVIPDGAGRMLVSCSASDSVLVVDARRFQVVGAHRMPERLYGRNYELSRQHSVVDHYITNDLQLTHVNCASPWRGGILTSSLIPGALGWFDVSGHHKELLRGFVGCHGARVATGGEIYFCDSCVGALVFVDDRMTIRRRIGTGSKWLHDAVQVEGDLFALAVYDQGEVWLMDVASRTVLHRIDCGPFGGPQFLAW